MKAPGYDATGVCLVSDEATSSGDQAALILSGQQIRRLMRLHGRTIRGIASRHQITMKRVREVRANGVTGFFADEWHWMLTGQWLTGRYGRRITDGE